MSPGGLDGSLRGGVCNEGYLQCDVALLGEVPPLVRMTCPAELGTAVNICQQGAASESGL